MARRQRVAARLRDRLRALADYRCGYCLTPEVLLATPMTLDHIVPVAAGGATVEDNLWLACPRCNRAKGIQTRAINRSTGEMHPLFDPRHRDWWRHFAWSDDGCEILGISDAGRVTVDALRLNDPGIVVTRRMWVSAGWWPPQA